jgi:glycosyltransferase involved in cell wall biosynthesis
MDLKLAVNARYQHRRIAGVDRYAHEISSRLQIQKRFIKPHRPLGSVAGHLWEQFVLPQLLHMDEILWSPANSSTWSVQNQIVSIHDASVFDHPEWFASVFGAWTRLSWSILAKRAKAIITVSEFSKQRLQYHLNIPAEKIHAVYNGVGEPFKPQSKKRIDEVKEKYGISKPYFLFVGTLEPRKNLKALLEAWKLLNSKTHELFISGGEGHVFPQPKLQIANSKYIPDEDLPALYSGAKAFVFPSLYEGFGLPILEAMACRTPVIASDIEVFREIYGDTIMFINPREPQEIADAMKTMIEDQSLSENLRRCGFQKAAQLSWDESTRKTQAIIKSIP